MVEYCENWQADDTANLPWLIGAPDNPVGNVEMDLFKYHKGNDREPECWQVCE